MRIDRVSRPAVALASLLIAGGTLANAQPLALATLGLYQRHLSPLTQRLGLECRFTPSCSRYAHVVIARDGVVRGGWATLKRLARCGPWTPLGTRDEP
jgi:putative membrane protein insertion efficiency factor